MQKLDPETYDRIVEQVARVGYREGAAGGYWLRRGAMMALENLGHEFSQEDFVWAVTTFENRLYEEEHPDRIE